MLSLDSPCSISSSSSLSSTFSELSSTTTTKTDAFFSSPFSTRPPSPAATPRSPSNIPISRIFPSRFSDSPSNPKPQFNKNSIASPISSLTLTIPESTPKLRPLQIQPLVLIPGDIITPTSPSSPSHSFPSSPSFPSPTPPELQSHIHSKNSNISLKLRTPLGQGAFSSVWLAEDHSTPALTGRTIDPRPRADWNPDTDWTVVAVKMTPRTGSNEEGDLERRRTAASFVREVEVLRHISHPNITPLLAHLTTPTHYVLVLPYVPGGDLLGLVNSDEAHRALGENILRRIWCELCKAVGWMHAVGLVHRDVKLENILLTHPLTQSLPTHPLVKLTDFGLSRFIDPAAPLLSTRCGSEAYAAPELVIGGRRYDGRETDAWACGVVLFALVGRGLPFGEGVRGGRKGRLRTDGLAYGHLDGGSEAERRSWLMRIARGEYEWPVSAPGEDGGEGDELKGPRLVESEGARRIVGRLLVRDPGKRARVAELWGDEWMQGAGGAEEGESSGEIERGAEKKQDVGGEGVLVDREGIDKIACEEVV